MKRLFQLSLIIFCLLTPAFNVGANEESKDATNIYLKLLSKEVCSNRANKCWPVALGRASNKTPNIKGPHYVLTHYTNGFNWKNPFTGVVYKKGQHNLGNIWIQILTTDKGIAIGFHETPTPNIPLSQQESLGGCVRMTDKDIKEFSSYVNYLDKIYILNE